MFSQKSFIYKVGFWSLLVCQLIILFSVPYFLFYLLEKTARLFKSFYLVNEDIWMYFFVLFIFTFIGLLFNCFIFFQFNKKLILIKMFILIISVLPMPFILPLALCQLIDQQKNDYNKSSNLFDVKNNYKKEMLLYKIGIYGLLFSNIFAIVWLLAIFNIESFFPGELNVDYSRMPIVYLTIYGIWTTLSLISVILQLIFKKNYLILITAIISFPLFITLGSLFATLLFLHVKDYLKNLYLSKFNLELLSEKTK